MGTYSAWESTATLRLLDGARGAWAPTEGGEGRGHIVSPRAQLVKGKPKEKEARKIKYHDVRLDEVHKISV